MRCYTRLQESRIRAQAAVHGWAQSGVIDATQADRLMQDLKVDLVRTNEFFRVGLACFAFFAVGALFALLESVLNISNAMTSAAMTLALAVACAFLAEALIRWFRFYHHGVEEALVVASVVLLGFTAEIVYDGLRGDHGLSGLGAASGFAVAAFAGLLAYVRYGYIYAAIGGMICAALVPFQPNLSPATSRSVAAGVFACAFVIARSLRARDEEQWPGDDFASIQAAAWLGLYVALNVKIGFDSITGAFYWFTYVMTLVLPAAGLVVSLRDKDRALLDVSIVIAIATLITNKPYLGWPRHEWDPIVLGVVLLAVVFGVRRWLSSAPAGHRRGITATKEGIDHRAILTLLSAVPFGTHSHAPASSQASPSTFDGGRSGGAGGGGTF